MTIALGTPVRKMSHCWSCLVNNEQGAQICPVCGADQARPVEIPDSNFSPPPTLTSFLHEWATVIIVIVLGVGILTGILWHNFGGYDASPTLKAAEIAANSLRDVREALSNYALATEAYPATLDYLADQTSLPIQAALTAGYKLQYSPTLSSRDGVYRGFVILARPERSDYLNLYIDESGVVRSTPENRPASIGDPAF